MPLLHHGDPKIHLDWKNLFSPPIGQFKVDQDNDIQIERLKEQYTEIFKPELGTTLKVSQLSFT